MMMTLRGLMTAAAFAAGLALSASSAMAGDSSGNFQIKAGLTGLWTDDETQSLDYGATDLLALGARASTDDIAIPTLTLTYFVNKNIAVELFCCFGQTSIVGEGLLNGTGEIAETWMFPPILTLQYHFDGMGAFKPYVGAGVEWIHYFDESVGANGLDPVATTLFGQGVRSVNLEDSFGFALQAGVDFDLGSGWSLGLDVKKVWEDTNVTWTLDDGTKIRATHDIDPLIATVNVGYRFNLSDLFGAREAAMK